MTYLQVECSYIPAEEEGEVQRQTRTCSQCPLCLDGVECLAGRCNVVRHKGHGALQDERHHGQQVKHEGPLR
jgi:hypothetical protein